MNANAASDSRQPSLARRVSVGLPPRPVVMGDGCRFPVTIRTICAPARARSLESPEKSIKKVAGFGRFFEGLHGQFIVLGGDVAGAQEGDLPWVMSTQSNCLQPFAGPANRHVRPLFRLPHKPTSVGSPGFDDCADSLARRWVSFADSVPR
jgi:hypothetical protein